MVNILFVHQNMPGQFKHLAAALASDRRNNVVFVTKRDDVEVPGVRRVTYKVKPASENAHPYVRLYESSIIHGQQVARVSLELLQQGYRPDVIVAHPGWGEALFLKDVFPKTPLLNFCEFYYRGVGADVGFDRDQPARLDDICRARARNAHLLLSLESCDAGLSPTQWQKASHPSSFQHKISVIFDGIDTDYMTPDETATVKLPNGCTLGKSDEVVTYVARNLEPYRGFPSFIRALPRLLRERPSAQVLIIGGDGISYGKRPPNGKSWREVMLEEVSFDRERVHFLGWLPYPQYRRVLQISSAHVYLTYPFVLSWSCIEAMSVGGLVVGSATPPVQEIIQDGINGLLIDFHSPEAIAQTTIAALAAPSRFEPLRRRARETVLEKYSLRGCLPQQLALLRSLL